LTSEKTALPPGLHRFRICLLTSSYRDMPKKIMARC
jgi:uncharacterized lipoprotein YbaY